MLKDLLRADSPDDVALGLLRLLATEGIRHHEESVTQLEHALQSARESETDTGDDAEVIAALLHDVGHLVTGEEVGADDFLARDLHHEEIGARVLSAWFPPEVTEPIRLHVLAKRYLCTVEPGYRERLSDVSEQSLVLQGGPLTDEECRRFEAGPFARRAVFLRRADDRAKVRGRRTRELSEYLPAIVAVLEERKRRGS
ncbi:MAG: HD domain-containing protein [Planctomycetota bacterium]|nr:HD domain-containing protein [Planctomycetota bacterium]MDA0932922.1 HD domain-containing protein [Planctomycetota bacterium]MDA1222960.1 HD domain-containing protein [Planctomycetota bacterium]